LALSAANACPAGAENLPLKRGKRGSNRLIVGPRRGRLEGKTQARRSLAWREGWASEEIEEFHRGSLGNGGSRHRYNLANRRCRRDEECNVAHYGWRCRRQPDACHLNTSSAQSSDGHFSHQDSRIVSPDW
jgi:hypothetical protein